MTRDPLAISFHFGFIFPLSLNVALLLRRHSKRKRFRLLNLTILEPWP